MKYDFILQYVLNNNNNNLYYLTIHVKFSLQIVSVGCICGFVFVRVRPRPVFLEPL